MSALLALAERCEQATGPDRELDAIVLATLDGYTTIEERNGWIVATGKGVMERSLGLIDPGAHSRNFTPQHHDTPAYTASLDAAMTLMPEGWQVGNIGEKWRTGGWHCDLAERPNEEQRRGWYRGKPYMVDSEHGEAATSALALCAAALRARAAAEQKP